MCLADIKKEFFAAINLKFSECSSNGKCLFACTRNCHGEKM